MKLETCAVALPGILLCLASARAPAFGRDPTLDERVEAQRAIEQVYWSHRGWPEENPGPKPPLSRTLSDRALRTRVEDYLRKSNALETVWRRPITAKQLQMELARMARSTKDPRTLRELFDALGGDPERIAETLARQTLADRLIRNRYASDRGFHGERRKAAEAALAACATIECLEAAGAEHTIAKWTLGGEDRPPAPHVAGQILVRLDADAYRGELAELASLLHGSADALPRRRWTGLAETEDAFTARMVLAQRDTEVLLATVAWRKRPFDDWWAEERRVLSSSLEEPAGPYVLPPLPLASCVDDAWKPTPHDVPDRRSGHTAVWTGSEMIVWGGSNLSHGDRYDPATDTWTTTTAVNAPAARTTHTAVWTGTQMIVWGGETGGAALDTGGRYDPTADTWTPTSTGASVPPPRQQHTAVWTGTEMIVWGGIGVTYTNTGGRYNPSTDTWTPTSRGASVPSERAFHTAVWTGAEMIVWGGYGFAFYEQSGARYNPATDAWTPTPTGASAPGPRWHHTAVWTGTEMIVWGGKTNSSSYFDTGGRYDPAANAWTFTSTTNAPAARSDHTAIWTGSEMIVWGGGDFPLLDTGGRYDPASNSWQATSTGTGVPSARILHTAIWTGAEMIVWGGGDNTGGRYDPSTDAWAPTSTPWNVPVNRTEHSAVWTGAEMVVWGGYDGSAIVSTGQRYDPATDAWTPTSTGAGAPGARKGHAAIWTGTEMIVWGGEDSVSALSSGARYDPSSDSWQATSTSGAAGPRILHTATWTGTEMIVWGGFDTTYLDTGGRYRPATDAWSATSTGGAPSPRAYHSAVWTGTELIVWGGYLGASDTSSGGRYDPASDAWAATSTGAFVPSPRRNHGAVWAGTEMVVWGGEDAGSLDTGGRYAPATDAWTPTSTAGAPAARSDHTAVWTGTELIVWGGNDTSFQAFDTGGRYNPSGDAWAATSTGSGAPTARTDHSAVWTGTAMIVWGGLCPSSEGGSYCACPGGALVYRDADGDGYGDARVSSPSCDGAMPAGYAATPTDCRDDDASSHPGAAEICDGLDNDCNGIADDGITAPAGAPSVTVAKSGSSTTISWSQLAGATAYDTVRGTLTGLRGSGGNFTLAVTACLADNSPATSVTTGSTPAPGNGMWYLVRGVNCGGEGSYDEGSGSQQGSRDAEIAASANACP